jgi:hypothetical protein
MDYLQHNARPTYQAPGISSETLMNGKRDLLPVVVWVRGVVTEPRALVSV